MKKYSNRRHIYLQNWANTFSSWQSKFGNPESWARIYIKNTTIYAGTKVIDPSWTTDVWWICAILLYCWINSAIYLSDWHEMKSIIRSKSLNQKEKVPKHNNIRHTSSWRSFKLSELQNAKAQAYRVGIACSFSNLCTLSINCFLNFEEEFWNVEGNKITSWS